MADTYSQIYIQLVFAVKYRQALIDKSWEEELYKYISGITRNKDQKMLAINGMPDHIHILIGMKPTCCLSNLVQEIKKSSDEFIKNNKFTKSKFRWQNGFGAFSYGHSQLDTIIRYINNQKEHHKKRSFKDEYEGFQKKYEVEYNEQYLFDYFDDLNYVEFFD